MDDQKLHSTEDLKEHYADYLGRTASQEDSLCPETAQRFQACLDRTPTLERGQPLPPLWHWLYFHTPVTSANLGADGHEKLGQFLPPLPYPKRMWAGSAVQFDQPLIIGEVAEKHSRIESIEFKTGASGPLCFVTVKHAFSQSGEHRLTDTQTLVYRTDRGKADKTQIRQRSSSSHNPQSLNAAFLFRYSALTYNAHRIHYDRDYAREVEGYPGLVVHGPLLASLIMERALADHPQSSPQQFEFRGLRPVFEGQAFSIQQQSKNDMTQLTLTNAEGDRAVAATLRWQS